jgi:hypothetical protein
MDRDEIIALTDNLIIELEEVVSRLATSYRVLASIQMDELRAKVDAWQASDERSISGKELYAQVCAVDFTAHSLEVRGDMNADTELRDMLRLKIDRLLMLLPLEPH